MMKGSLRLVSAYILLLRVKSMCNGTDQPVNKYRQDVVHCVVKLTDLCKQGAYLALNMHFSATSLSHVPSIFVLFC